MPVTPSSPEFAPIAIIGMGCRFPGAPSVGDYWRLLLEGVDAITEVPRDRWDVDAFYDPRPATPCKMNTRSGGFLPEIDRFDAYFFGISPREAVRLDPQQRLMLETTWEAMEHAGIPRERLVGSRTGVFVGVCTDDYVSLERGDFRNIDIYMGTGGSRGSTAGRVAFAYGLTGPVAAIDTACSSSLVAVHQACNSLQVGDCDMALAGGVNVILHPGTAVAFSQAGMLAPDGRCKAFDARANGFVRSEGAGVVLLKPLARALEDGDPIHAVIRSTASNNDGAGSPFMTPSRAGQAELLRHVYERAGLSPASVRYVEAHGTGTEVGDPVEMGALADVLAEGRAPDATCLVGSSKTNIGHLEAAAGVAGLIKTVLCLQHRTIPPNLHHETPNPDIPWDTLPFRVPTAPTPWPAGDGPAFAGVNSFGISGTNAHVVLEEAPLVQHADAEPQTESRGDDAALLLLSAHTTESLAETAAAYRDLLADDRVALRDVCYSAAARRTQHDQRLALVGRSREELRAKLGEHLAGSVPTGLVTGTVAGDRSERPVFVFSGIGTQWPEMGRGLLEREPVFRDTMRRCDAIVQGIVGWSVLEEIARPADTSRLDRIDIMQPTTFSVQVALAALWRHWGVEPAAVVGHSLGEYAAAHVAGALSLEDAALGVCERSRVMHRTSGQGRMAAVGLPHDELVARLAAMDVHVSIAAINAPATCAISGDRDVIESVAARFEQEGVFCRLLKVEVACHSFHMDPLRGEVAARLAGITPRAATIPLYSTVRGARITGEELDGAYWAANLRGTVQFARAVGALLDDGHRSFLEISPNPALLTPLRQNAGDRRITAAVTPSLRTGVDERTALLEAAGALFVAGTRLDWSALHPGARFVPPPPYRYQRERFWFESSEQLMRRFVGSSSAGAHGTGHPLLGLHWEPADAPGTHVFEAELNLAAMPWLADHRVEGMPLLPAAAYVEMAIAASMALYGTGPRVVHDVALRKALFLSAEHPTTVQLVVRTGAQSGSRVATTVAGEATRSLSFHVHARTTRGGDETNQGEWTEVASGFVDVAPPASAPVARRFDAAQLDAEFPDRETGEEFYASIRSGMDFGPAFRGVQQVWSGERHAVSAIALSQAAAADARSFRLPPTLLDAAFHTGIAGSEKRAKLSLPLVIDRFELHALPEPGAPLWVEVTTEEVDGDYHSLITIHGDDGTPLVTVTGYQSRLLHPETESESARWLYESRWRTAPREASETSTIASNATGVWLVIADGEATTTPLQEALARRGRTALFVPAVDDGRELAALVTECIAGADCAGIVYLAGGATDDGIDVDAARESRRLLAVLHGTARLEWTTPPRLFVVTTEAKDPDGLVPSLALGQAPLAGLARVAAVELRELHVTQVDRARDTDADALAAELVEADAEQEVALRGEARYVPRLTRLDTTDRATVREIRITDDATHGYRLESAGSGVFDDLALRLVPRRPPGPGEVEIRVAAVGLNFLDVLKALNMAPGLPEGARFFGMECAGRIVAVGEGVAEWRVGDEVLALDTTASGTFRAFLTTNATSVLPKPAGISLAEAVTMPVAYQTAYYALCELGRLRAGESVLIHSAAGGVGLAALHIAKSRGAVVFATAGTQEKRDFLAAQGVPYVMNSRSLDFVRETRAYTNGRGVDLVLNSLAGEAIPQSLGLLATGGRFIEIGKRDIYADSQLGMLPFQRNLSFFAVDLLRMRMEKPQVVDELTRDIARLMADGSFQPLPSRTFTARDAAEAFRYMAKGSHIGKIVVTLDDEPVRVEDVPPPVPVRADASYLVTGGLGALGLAFARRLVAQGARHLTLLGRRAPTADAAATIAELQAQGAEVDVVAADVADFAALSGVVSRMRATGVPIKGVLHAAGITDDRTLQQLVWAQFESVYASKVSGGWNLHRLFADDSLDFFVLFSSAASVMGGGGQANYAAANAFLDALAVQRRREGLPALAVNWGPWAEVGMAAIDDNRGARLAERGLGSIPVQEGTELLDLLLQQRPAAIAVMPIDWPRWAESFPESTRVPFVSGLAAEWSAGGAAESPKSGIRQELLACATPHEATELLHAHLRRDIARILRFPEERIGLTVSLVRFGLDSLMAVELKNRIETDFVVNLPAAKLLQGPSVQELAEWLLGELGSSHAVERVAEPEVEPQAAVDVDALSDAEVNAMLDAMLARDDAAS